MKYNTTIKNLILKVYLVAWREYYQILKATIE